MRDMQKNPQYWESVEEDRMETIHINEGIMKKGPRSEEHRNRLRLSRLDTEFELFLAAYSKGAPLEQCREMYLQCLRCSEDLWKRKTNYTDLVWYVALGVLFRVEPQDAAILERITVATGCADQLTCAFLRALNPNNTVRVMDDVPHPYRVACAVLDMDCQKAESALVKYLERTWYQGQKTQLWHDNHKLGGYHYLGYWSFETAALVRILGLNDEKLKKSPYYPPDLADYQ